MRVSSRGVGGIVLLLEVGVQRNGPGVRPELQVGEAGTRDVGAQLDLGVRWAEK